MTQTRPTLGRRLTGAVAAVAITLAGLTATAAPARAQGDEFAKFLFGAATIAIIGSAIANAGQPQYYAPAPTYYPPQPVYRPPVYAPRPVYVAPPVVHRHVTVHRNVYVQPGRPRYVERRVVRQQFGGFGPYSR